MVILNYQGQTAEGQGSFTAVPGLVTVVGPGITDGQTVRGRVFLIAEVNSPAAVTSVTFLLDGQQLATLSAPPYRYDWDSDHRGAGRPYLDSAATDEAGNEGRGGGERERGFAAGGRWSRRRRTPPEATAAAEAAAQPSRLQVIQAQSLAHLGQGGGRRGAAGGALVTFLLTMRNRRAQRQVQAKICQVEIDQPRQCAQPV